MKLKDIKRILEGVASVVFIRHGVITAKRSYFWGVTQDGSKFAEQIQSLIPQAQIQDYGNHYHGFVGGAKPGSAQDSYFFCKFKI